MIGNSSRVKVRCNKCGGDMYSDEFVVDPDFKMAVCPNCIREKKKKQEVWAEVGKQREATRAAEEMERRNEEAKKPKPAGWDKDDEVLERLAKIKQNNQAKEIFKDAGSGKIKCSKCGYAFKYDSAMNKPLNCPYCFNPVKRKSSF